MKIIVALLLIASAFAQENKPVKAGLTWEDYAYKMAAGVVARDVTFYSDGVACYGKIFFPPGYSTSGKTPGIVLGQGWAGTHYSIEKYGARFAERGLVAMVIDYRGWGLSDGFLELPRPRKLGDDNCKNCRDEHRFTNSISGVVTWRTRLLPMKQVEDYRNAISYIQGEPGVDPERIGVWGSSYAGGHSLVVAALDARVKAVSVQIPGIAGKLVPPGPNKLTGKLLEDAMARAREGKGGEYETGYSTRRMVDIETQQAVAEYRPMHYVPLIGARPVQIVVAAEEQLMKNSDHGRAAYDMHSGPKNFISVANTSHFEMYIGDAFEQSSKAAADWFVKYLGGAKTGGE